MSESSIAPLSDYHDRHAAAMKSTWVSVAVNVVLSAGQRWPPAY